MIREVKIQYLFLPWKHLKNIYELWKIFCFKLIIGFGEVFCSFGGYGLVKQGSKGVS